MNKNYDWNETNTTVTITFPLLYKIDKKKFDYTITDSYIKLNLYQMKQFHFIDLMDESNKSVEKMGEFNDFINKKLDNYESILNQINDKFNFLS